LPEEGATPWRAIRRGIDDNFAPRGIAVAHRAADDESPGQVDMVLGGLSIHLPGSTGFKISSMTASRNCLVLMLSSC
jgi:hypothetical protein